MSVLRKILIFLTALTLLFIWGNSLLPGDLSSEESDWVQQLLSPVLDFIGGGRAIAALSAMANRLPAPLARAVQRLAQALDAHILSAGPSFLVRKAAHFSEYALLGFLVGLLCARADGRGRFLRPEGLCLGAAVADECIQLFSDGRAAQIRDVCVDLAGATTGLLVALVLLCVLRSCLGRRRPEFGKK